MRLFANVWYPIGSNYSNINVNLRFTLPSENLSKVTGLLRHVSAYDVALSEPTGITSVHAPRFHAPNFTQWIVADFQMAYDPCSCQSQGELQFVFTSFNTLDVDIIGRSVAIDVPITDDNYTTKDFLNISDINVDSYEPGTEIYQNMDRLAREFEKKQFKYLEDLEAYNEANTFAASLQKFAIKQVGKYLTGGLSDILISDSLLTWVANDDWKDATTLEGLTPGVEPETVKNKFADKAKELIGDSFGFLSTEVFNPVPEKPTPPAVPVATLEESVYKGTISAVDTTFSSNLLLPGSTPSAYPLGTSLEPHRLPVYNEVLGQVALLETPEPLFYLDLDTVENILSYDDEPAPFGGGINCYITKEFRSKIDFKMRFDEELKIALNGALDFDHEQTQTYVQVQLKLANTVDVSDQYLYDPGEFESYTDEGLGTNLSLDRKFADVNGTKLEFISEWVSLEELNQMVFQLVHEEVFEFTGTSFSTFTDGCDIHDPFGLQFFKYELKQLNIKLMHDMYFDQIGSSNKQVNSLQIHTFRLYDKASNINHLPGMMSNWSDQPTIGTFDAYLPGVVTLGDEVVTVQHPAVQEVIGTKIVIAAQEVVITAPLIVQAGFSLVIKALDQIRLAPTAALDPRVHLQIIKDFYTTPVFDYANNSEVLNFCSNNAYQANNASKSRLERMKVQQPQASPTATLSQAELGNNISIYPNPTSDAVWIRSSELNIAKVVIYDITGREVLERVYNGEMSKNLQINIPKLQNGVYLIQVQCGSRTYKEKLVVGK